MMCGGNGWGWGGWGSNGWGSSGWILMTVLAVLFFAVVITAVVVATRYLTGSHHTPAQPIVSGSARAEDLLASRFARGEINEDEYRRRMTLLQEHR